MNLFSGESPLVIGLDKWGLESRQEEPFFWLGEPFFNSSARGFLDPGVDLKRDFPMRLLINLDDLSEISIEMFELEHKVLFASEWHEIASRAATFASDIFLFQANEMKVVKKDFKLL